MQTHETNALTWLVASPVLIWGLISGFYLHQLADHPVLFWMHDVLGWVVVPAICLALLKSRFGLVMRDMGLPSIRDQMPDAGTLAKTLLVTLAFVSFIGAQELFYRLTPPTSATFSYAEVMPKGGVGKLTALYLALSAAIVEELFYRGLLHKLICNSSPTRRRQHLFVVGSALLFAINHWGQGTFKILASIYLGLVAAWLFIRWRNLWFLIFGHFILNSVTV